MGIELSKEETKGIVPSIQRFFGEELEIEINEMRAKFLLDFFLKEIAPFAHNKGIRDAETFFRERIEDLQGACWQEGVTYWQKKKPSF